MAPSKFVEPLTELFNSVSGYEAIILYQSKNGFLTSLFGMKDVYKIDNFPSIMMTAISKKVDYALATYEASSDGGSIPVVDFDGNPDSLDAFQKLEQPTIERAEPSITQQPETTIIQPQTSTQTPQQQNQPSRQSRTEYCLKYGC